MPHRSRTEPFDAVLVSALDSAGLAVIITDLDLEPPGPIIRYVNRMFEDMTGFARAEVLGKSPRILQGPTTDPEVLCRLKTSLQADDYFCGETINYRKDGEPYAVRWIITPIMGVHGLPSHWIALLMEVTNESRTREAYAAELEERAQKALRAIDAADKPL